MEFSGPGELAAFNESALNLEDFQELHTRAQEFFGRSSQVRFIEISRRPVALEDLHGFTPKLDHGFEGYITLPSLYLNATTELDMASHEIAHMTINPEFVGAEDFHTVYAVRETLCDLFAMNVRPQIMEDSTSVGITDLIQDYSNESVLTPEQKEAYFTSDLQTPEGSNTGHIFGRQFLDGLRPMIMRFGEQHVARTLLNTVPTREQLLDPKAYFGVIEATPVDIATISVDAARLQLVTSDHYYFRGIYE